MSSQPDIFDTPTSARQAGLKFVHTADLHLDSPLRSLALVDNELANIVESATRTALVRIVDLCINENVDALLIAGDLYDGDQKSMHTAALLINQMRRLHKANIPVFIIRGNHDFQSAITKRLKLPDNVHVFSSKGQCIELEGKSAFIHGVSFAKKHVPESLLPKFRSPQKDSFNIGMLHTSLNGSPAHDEYAPCSAKELDDHGYHYWALGHIHKRSEHGTKSKIVMPGIPQGRDIGETGPGTASLVTLNAEGKADVEQVVVGPAQFEYLSVDLSDTTDWNQAVNHIQEAIAELRASSNSDHLIVRLILTGKTKLHFKLIRDLALLEEIIREQLASSANTWIEKFQCETTTSPSEDSAPQELSALPDLSSIIQADVLETDNLRKMALKEVELFVAKLPADSRHIFGDNEEQRLEIIDSLLREGSELLLQNASVDDEQ